MKRLCTVLVCSVAVMAVYSFGRLDSAQAYPTFLKAFQKKYVGDEKTDTEKTLAKEIKRAKKCYVCHDPRPGADGKVSKKNRNPYGQALNKYLTEKDKKDVKKAEEMLSKVENMKPDGSDKTFGELIKEGKLPIEFKDAKTGTDDDANSK